ncbi:hypothetical protein [Hymenobacter swuensis]|uniref:Uncharacterized protein n=1 Tax=Hymenobacter swuensis DY53 TaxID=1227739 RepID=W8F218_9BACT|nr:hypothetical protein [Hymenobacter swuensis]AHJ98953.1 hypothetical protein Hsw_3358 [Hymenobacter swuensis DY53]
MKRLFRYLALAVYPVPYPFAAGYHALVGATLWWWLLYGAPASYSFGKVAIGAAVGLVVGALLVLVLGKQLEEKA